MPSKAAATGTAKSGDGRCAVAFLLDSNISDIILADDALKSALRRAVDRGEIRLLVTHVQIDENLNHPDGETGRRLINSMMSTGVIAIPAFGTVVGVSRPENSRLFDDETAAMFEAFVQGNASHSEDGILAATALKENAVFVTAENPAHRRRLTRHFPGLQVWTPDELWQYVDARETARGLDASTVAAGTLMTPTFEGPGGRESSIALKVGHLKNPQLRVQLLPVASAATPRRLDTSLDYSIEGNEAGVRFTVRVKRRRKGREPEHVLRWELGDAKAEHSVD